eukprot:TRINITY_DN4048_c0_g3_i1.p1 TRINITY_DN4048_c0_g3~~TRINITY_DN4048_c0_g3_i1.p1  ORF type:complete len:221 (-),score=38.33 TRINITY_DN4048_c0_g3_i1:152-754(-)
MCIRDSFYYKLTGHLRDATVIEVQDVTGWSSSSTPKFEKDKIPSDFPIDSHWFSGSHILAQEIHIPDNYREVRSVITKVIWKDQGWGNNTDNFLFVWVKGKYCSYLQQISTEFQRRERGWQTDSLTWDGETPPKLTLLSFNMHAIQNRRNELMFRLPFEGLNIAGATLKFFIRGRNGDGHTSGLQEIQFKLEYFTTNYKK